ncbi:hypothetical protein AOLI_G00007620 [Acnodon oligacanthus]
MHPPQSCHRKVIFNVLYVTLISTVKAGGERSAEVRLLYPYLKAPTKRDGAEGAETCHLLLLLLRVNLRRVDSSSCGLKLALVSDALSDMPEETAAAAASVEEKPCSSSAADSSVDVAEEAKKLIGTGNRHLVMGDVVSAVSVFQEACAMLAEKYGDTADECGEAFFLCGKSLLELARMENTVLGNALEGVPEESSEEGEKQNDSKIESADNLDEKTRDELREQVYDAMSEDKRDSDGEVKKEEQEVKDTGDVQALKQDNTDSSSKNETESPIEKGDASESPVKSEQKAAENEEKTTEVEEGSAASRQETLDQAEKDAEQDVKSTEQKGDEDNPAPMEEEGGDDDEEEEEEGEGDDEDKESEEDDVGNLQLAWEMLEVAKVIYKRKESEEDQLMAAQIFLKLGEVGAESGNYTQALEDFQECLAIQLKHLPTHSRLLAETHYQLGTTFNYTAQYSQAIEHFNNSIKVIESRLAMLQEAIDKAEGADEAKEEKSELEELKQLLPEIAEKIEDAKESQKTAAAASEAIHQTLGGASTSAFPAENGGPSSSTASQIAVKPVDGASSSKAASDISHLVRKKRKPEEESPKNDSDAKKVKQETAVNGSGDSASNSNGVQEKMEQEPVNSSSSVEASA